MHTTWRYSSVG